MTKYKAQQKSNGSTTPLDSARDDPKLGKRPEGALTIGSEQSRTAKSQITNPKIWIFILGISALCLSWILYFGFWNLTSAEENSKEEEALFVAKKAFEDGFYEVSLGLLERFLKNYPDSPKVAQAQLLIGQCYFHQNKYQEALEKFEWLLNQPNASSFKDALLYWIAEVHFKINNFSKAQDYYQRIITDFPKSSYLAFAYYSLGFCLFQEHNFLGAKDNFQKVTEGFPKEPVAQDAAFKIIECLYNSKDYSGLKEKIKSYLKDYAKDTTRAVYLYFYLAEGDYYLNNFSEAIAEYAKLSSMTQDAKMLGLAKLGTGWAYLKLKRYNEAGEIFQQLKDEALESSSREMLLLGRAILLVEDKRFNEATRIYNDLLKSSEDDLVLLQAYLGKAEALYNAAEYKNAIAVYQEALARKSDFTTQELADKLHNGLAWSYLKEGQFKEAIAEFQKIAKQSEDKILKVSALCQVGDTYQDSGDYKKAIETYDGILKEFPDSFYSDYVQYQLGACFLKTANYDGAIMAFQALKKNFPHSKLLDDSTYALGLSYFQRENYPAAKEILEKFEEEFKDSGLRPQAMYLLGTSLYNLQKFNEAVEVYRNIIRLFSQDSELAQKAEYEIADCYYQMGNEKEAMNRFKSLRAKYPDSSLTPEIIWWLGEYYYRNNNLDLARRYFSSLTQDFPKSNLLPNAYYALGSVYLQESKYAEALENFRKAKELGKTDLTAQAAIAIADIYVKEGQNDLALSTYEDVVKEFNNLADLVYPQMAEIYQKGGNEDKAIEYYRKSLDIVPIKEMGNIQFKLAEALQSQGKFQEAIGEYLKATYLYPEDKTLVVKALLSVAAIYEDKQNYKEALNIYRRIVALNVPEAKYAQERIDWIKKNIKTGG